VLASPYPEKFQMSPITPTLMFWKDMMSGYFKYLRLACKTVLVFYWEL